MNPESILGLLGGIITTIAGVPQIIQMIRTKQTADLNWTMVMLWLIGLTLTLIYGISINQLPIIVPTVLSLLTTIIMIAIKFYYEIVIKIKINDYEKVIEL